MFGSGLVLPRQNFTIWLTAVRFEQNFENFNLDAVTVADDTERKSLNTCGDRQRQLVSRPRSMSFRTTNSLGIDERCSENKQLGLVVT